MFPSINSHHAYERGWFFILTITRWLSWISESTFERNLAGIPTLSSHWMHELLHGTIIWRGMTCKKIPCYMRDSACRWFIVKKTKIFWSYVKHFWILAGVRNVKFWLVYANKLAWIAQPYISTNITKQS